MIISIDSGNKNIKTENFIFPSALSEAEFDIGFGEDVMEYKGKCYSINVNGDRVMYMRDKTEDENYFILALFGIAKEIEKKAADGELTLKEVNSYQITLLNGMPPKHLADADKFRKYFLTDKPVTFKYNRREYRINIKEVYIFPQAFAVVGLLRKQIMKEEQLLLIDVGGWTTDFMLLNRGKYNNADCQSLNYGVNKFYTKVQDYCNNKHNIYLRDKDIDDILKGTCTLRIPEDIKEYAFNAAREFCNVVVRTINERIKTFSIIPIMFIGGGAVTLEKFFKEHSMLNNASYVDDIKANAKGYKVMYKILRRQK